MTPDQRSEWIDTWLTTQEATEQWNKPPAKRVCPVCGMTCSGFYRFAVPCNPEREQAREMTR